MRKFILFLLCLFSFSKVYSEYSMAQRKMLNDLDFITNIFEISYAPASWKNEHFGWNLEHEKLKAKNAILKNPDSDAKQFHQIIKNFCLSTKDYHVVPQFYSTEESSLPFHIQSVNNKYYVSFIDSDVHVPFSVGDQLLFFNGIPIHETVNEFCSKEFGGCHTPTDKSLGEFYFTNRTGTSGLEVPSGEVEIIYRKVSLRNPQVCKLIWDYSSEQIEKTKFHMISKSLIRNDNSSRKPFITPHYHRIRSVCEDNYEPSDLLGSRKSRIPSLGQILWESEEDREFHAYLFLLEDNNIGAYVRIPSYAVDDGDKAALEFAELIDVFQQLSDVLVIDQQNNGGGYILYLYALAAMLTERELEVPLHRMMITQADVFNAITRNRYLGAIKNDRAATDTLGDTIEGMIVNYKLARCLFNSHQFIINQWNMGKMYTDFSYLYGIEKIWPHPKINYTKPILVLANNLDFSAADFFAAIMKDNKRATILGSNTAGAGGYTEKISFPNLNGIEEIGITASFSVRTNGRPIENVGVEPDIFYEPTENDLQNNYIEYKQKILHTIKDLLSMEITLRKANGSSNN